MMTTGRLQRQNLVLVFSFLATVTLRKTGTLTPERSRAVTSRNLLMGETEGAKTGLIAYYYYCYGREREMERCGSSQGLDL